MWTAVSSYRFGIVRSVLRSQGIANDGQGHYWYSSTQGLLRTNSKNGFASHMHLLPIPHPLTELKDNHIGDIDYANGKIFAPIEDGPNYKNPFVGVYDAKTLEIENFYSLPQPWQKDGVPWVAVDSKNGKVFSSEYLNVTKINVYDLLTFKALGQIPLSIKMESIQGAKILDGMIYMTANDNTGSGFAIYKGDLSTGVVTKIALSPNNLVEVEGLTLSRSKDGLVIDALGVVPYIKKVHLTRRMVLFTFRKN
jgi:hypothetical protein